MNEKRWWRQRLKFWVVRQYAEAEAVSLLRLVAAKLVHIVVLREAFRWL